MRVRSENLAANPGVGSSKIVGVDRHDQDVIVIDADDSDGKNVTYTLYASMY